MTSYQLDTIRTGLAFGEGPRWRDDRLFYSDMHRNVVETVTLDGDVEVICEVPNNPSGLGWLPDGRMLVVSMLDRKVLRLEPDGQLVVHADLWDLATFHCNDMVVDSSGIAYVGNFGFDLHGEGVGAAGPAELIRVEPMGSASVAAPNVLFPNGSVITPDESTLILAQSFAGDLLAFDIEADGTLGDRRQWANLNGGVPDGICLDAEGAVWYADPIRGGVHRVAEGGQELDEIQTEDLAFACMLGGPERRHLFVLTAADSNPANTLDLLSGKILVGEVDVPGAGLP